MYQFFFVVFVVVIYFNLVVFVENVDIKVIFVLCFFEEELDDFFVGKVIYYCW